jgi:mono/diheme cytochrome c family protein
VEGHEENGEEKALKRMKWSWSVLAIVASCGGLACSQGSEGAANAAAASPAVVEGKQLYQVNCTACHNTDPSQNGALGPAIAGSPETLLEAKVLRNEYPPGYTPKRQSHAMVPLPQLKGKIPELAAYLASVAKGS